MKLNQHTKTAWLVIIMDFFHYIAYMCTKPYLKTLLGEAGAPADVTGVILSLFSVVQVLNALFLSKWIQKKGQKPQLIFGSALYMIAGMGLMFSASIASFISIFIPISVTLLRISIIAFCTVMLGSSHGIFLLCGHYIITGLPEDAGRAKYVGYLTFVNSIGQFIGPVLASVLLGEFFTKYSPDNIYIFVLLLSVVASAISLALSVVIRNVRSGQTRSPAKVGSVLKDGPLMKIVLINSAVYFATDVLSSYLQDFGVSTLLLAPALATTIITVMKFAQIFVRAFLGFLIKKVGSKRLLNATLCIVAISIVGMGLTNPVSSVLSALGLPVEIVKIVVVMSWALIFGLANGLVNPLALIELSNVTTDDTRSPALALRNMCNSGGQGLGETAFGFLAKLTGSLSSLFFISGGLMFVCYIYSHDFKKKKKNT